jgi:glutamate synthase (ferredoxin)
LEDWEIQQINFVKVMPTDYKKALQRAALESNKELLEVSN